MILDALPSGDTDWDRFAASWPVPFGALADVTAHLGPSGCYAFIQALSVVETFQRACLTLGIRSLPDVDDLTRPSPDESQEVSR